MSQTEFAFEDIQNQNVDINKQYLVHEIQQIIGQKYQQQPVEQLDNLLLLYQRYKELLQQKNQFELQFNSSQQENQNKNKKIYQLENDYKTLQQELSLFQKNSKTEIESKNKQIKQLQLKNKEYEINQNKFQKDLKSLKEQFINKKVKTNGLTELPKLKQNIQKTEERTPNDKSNFIYYTKYSQLFSIIQSVLQHSKNYTLMRKSYVIEQISQGNQALFDDGQLLLQNFEQLTLSDFSIFNLQTLEKTMKQFYEFIDNFEALVCHQLGSFVLNDQQGFQVNQNIQLDETKIQQIRTVKDLEFFVQEYKKIIKLHEELKRHMFQIIYQLDLAEGTDFNTIVKALQDQIEQTQMQIELQEQKIQNSDQLQDMMRMDCFTSDQQQEF